MRHALRCNLHVSDTFARHTQQYVGCLTLGDSHSVFIMSIALGGCIKAPPVQFGLTEDTGGHIGYALGAGMALAERADVDRVELVTRLIDTPLLGEAYARPLEVISGKFAIRRLDTGDRDYLSKDANAADRPAFTQELLNYIAGLSRKPDIIHAHFADAAEVAITVRERFGIPFIYTAHSLGIDKAATGDRSVSPARVAEEQRAVVGADAIIASSRDEAERQLMLYRGACASRIHCVTPGSSLSGGDPADPARARALLRPFLRDMDRPMILAIARPVAKKNLVGLVDMFATDPELKARANLVIVAGLRDGPDSGEAEQRGVIGALLGRLDTHDLYGRMALPKRHDAADIAGLYALARDTGGVFVNPALTEPYGLTISEAAVNGLPVVATCHGGPADIVARLHHGQIADPRDPVAFTAAIRTLLDDRTMWACASRQGRENARRFDWKAYAARFVEIAIGLTTTAAEPARADRLLLCDIDNTLTGCFTGARAMSSYLEDQPNLAFGVATGRSLQEAVRLLDEWQQPAPRVLITSVGSEIYWLRGGRLWPDTAYADHIAVDWVPYEIEHRLDDLAGIVRQPLVEQRRFKRSWFVEAPKAIAELRLRLADLPVRVVHSHGNLLDILPARAGKGAAMAWAARVLGIPVDRVYAAGDSGNDLDMLEACRNGIVVANHSAELRQLIGRPTIYASRRSHAGGVVEGMLAYADRAAA